MQQSNNKDATNADKDNLDWLLHSSHKFTTELSKDFLKRTVLPADFLKTCVKYLHRKKRSDSTSNNNVYMMLHALSTQEQNKILRISRSNRYNLLRLVRNERSLENNVDTDSLRADIEWERKTRNRTLKVIKKMKSERWNCCLDNFEGLGIYPKYSDGLGVCPKCTLLFFKDGGCNYMHCPCGMVFHFAEARLELDLEKLGRTKRVLSEYFFRQRLLKAAEGLLLSSLGPDRKKKNTHRRPVMRNESNRDVIEDIRSDNKNFNRSFPSLSCVAEEEESGENEIMFEKDPRCSDDELECESNSFSRLEERPDDDDEFSLSAYTTATTTTLCEYIFVSDSNEIGDGIMSLSPSPVVIDEDEYWEEECSYSLLSGCDTVYSLDNDHSGNVSIGPQMKMDLSYCIAAKLGNSKSKTAKASPAPSIEVKERDDGPTRSTMDYKSPYCQKETRGNKLDAPTSSRHCSYFDEDENAFFLSAYDAAKSCHGGRVAFRFKGNGRTSHSPSGWGNHRRPNWSRKRRKDYKKRWR